MIVEAGHYALVLALALAIVQSVVPLWGAYVHDKGLMQIAPSVALMQCMFVVAAYAALTHAYVTSDFSVLNVAENSHSAKPLIYRISGVWGNHEGSMLLWVLILALYGAGFTLFSSSILLDMRARILSVQGWISTAFLLFILATSNPFARLTEAPAEGRDLNPILQDPGLAIHPPLLYLGYVGLSMTFSFAMAALISGRIDALWARHVRPWTLLSWLFLTLGIAMGSYWAYYTLGWGGFWFWDPVENASLMPWLAATALLHSAVVMEKRDALKIWTVFLAILAFSLSLIGTFLVRSGVLTSVHAFASDPTRGVFILVILLAFIGGSLGLFAWRAQALKPGGLFAPMSREGSLVLNNLLLSAICAAVFVGTLYPLALESLNGEKISVGAPFFNLATGPLAAILVLAMPVGQMLAWKRGDFLGAAQRLMVAMLAGLLAAALLYAVHGGALMAAVLAGLAIFLMVGSFVGIWNRVFAKGVTPAVAMARISGMPRSAWGASFAHAGLGLTLLGLAATGWGEERILALRKDDVAIIGPFEATLEALITQQGPNYRETQIPLVLRQGGIVVARLEPSRRYYPSRQTSTSQAGIVTLSMGQVYASVAEPAANGTIDLRLYWKPLVTLIWIGALVMAFGGVLSLSDRRLRIGFVQKLQRTQAGSVMQGAAE